jgi:hypothetical protein
MSKNASGTERRSYWQNQITQAKKRYKPFWDAGDEVITTYMLQKADGHEIARKDKLNILFSTTETTRPNLYAQRPNVAAKLRHKDRQSQPARDAVQLIGNCCQYVIEEEDFDDVMQNAVEDFLLPGLGQAWVRYEPRFGPINDQSTGKPMIDPATKKPMEQLLDEQVIIDYLYWKDFLTGSTRGWKTVPWAAKCLWLNKKRATRYFGAEKAQKLVYASRESYAREADNSEETAEVWEIWDKEGAQVLWYCDSYSEDVIHQQDDPLKLKNFFPCPRPLRAISNTRNFVPRALYSQYKTQAEQLNLLTRKIRMLTDGLKVAGVYNSAQTAIGDILNPNSGNKMIPVTDWVQFAEAGGMKGVVDWLPIADVVNALRETIAAREICKQEIYEITGFSDIVRGVSKASETLGAQNIKANWASARVKKMQRDVQRFARDLIAIAGEIISEHCTPATIALFGGVEINAAAMQAGDAGALETKKRFDAAVALLRDEGRRVANIDIETDSTILADEEADRKDRMDFLAAAGAFLQQAVPAAQATPELGPLLGAMLMFTIRTFPSSRSIEDEFVKVQRSLENRPPQPPNQDPNGHQAKAQAAQQVAQMRASTDQARIQSDQQTAQMQAQQKHEHDMAMHQLEQQKEFNRHNERMEEVRLKEQELVLRAREVAVKEAELQIDRDAQVLAEETAAHQAGLAEDQQELSERTAEHGAVLAERGSEQEDTRIENAAEADKQKGLTAKKD